MKKILLTLAMTFSFSAAMAEKGPQVSLLHKAPANSGIHQQMNKDFDQCTINCLNQFQSCIATAQGSYQWWLCELAFERCESRCF